MQCSTLHRGYTNGHAQQAREAYDVLDLLERDNNALMAYVPRALGLFEPLSERTSSHSQSLPSDPSNTHAQHHGPLMIKT